MYVPDPTRGRPVFNGNIYIGEPDTDPKIPSNQKVANLIQENGTSVPALYPIETNAGGIPTYNGSPVAIDVDGAYSIRVDDRNGNQVYYYPVSGVDDNLVDSDLRSIMFDFGLLYADIGSSIVTSIAGVSLDNAVLILNISTGMVLNLPTNIPPSSVVVGLEGFILTTNNGQFTLTQAFSNSIENKFKGNQNWNVNGTTGDPLPGVTPTTYNIGSQVSYGIEVITNNAEQITLVAGVLNSGNNTGVLRRRYAKDSAGLITKSSQYGGIKLADNSQVQALIDDISTNGVRITEDGADIVVDVDLSVVTGGFIFFGLSDNRGVWPVIGNDDSINSIYNELIRSRVWVDVFRLPGFDYDNDEQYEIEVKAYSTLGTTPIMNISVDGVIIDKLDINSTSSRVSVSARVPPGSSYAINITNATLDKVSEYRI